MSRYEIALIGFGTVGQGFAQILSEQGEALRERYGCELVITAVSDLRKGSVHDPSGLDPAALLAAVAESGGLDGIEAPQRGWDALRTIRESNAGVVAELSYTDLKTGEPGLSHVREALDLGKHVITTNKGPVALRFPELQRLARSKGVRLGVEGTVMSGTPALQLGTELLAGAGVSRIEGILNGTTNYILGRMEQGLPYAEALAEAQAEGYAEADPSGDVEGLDAAGKLVILANLVLGAGLGMADVERTGITGLTPEQIAAARREGERWKLLGTLQREDGRWRAVVEPRRLRVSHPLAGIGGATNAITYTTGLLGEVTLVGPGAGRLATGYALVSDLLAIHRSQGGRA